MRNGQECRIVWFAVVVLASFLRTATAQDPIHGAHDCADCRTPLCSGWCTISDEAGLFRLGQPDQVAPSPSGWIIIVPALPPPPPKPGTPAKPKPPVPWKALYFENDFSYVDDPDSPYRNTFDFLKRRRFLDDALTASFGGEFRWQARGEDNRRLTGEQNNFNLFRERLYLDTWLFDTFRFYGEVYWADGSEQTVPAIFTDIDHGDVNNFFAETRLYESLDGWWSFRYGWHEELLFGNQRMVSPLDWANVRRTFDLVPHLLHRGKDWNFDLLAQNQRSCHQVPSAPVVT